MNAREAIKLLKEVGVYRLAGFEGCICGSCEVQGVHIDVSCRKSSGSDKRFSDDPDFYGPTVRVYSNHLDSRLDDLRLIADEATKQLAREADSFVVRLCDREHDKDPKCIYCGEPRKDLLGYYCTKHEKDKPCG